jgi:hypothetical protein
VQCQGSEVHRLELAQMCHLYCQGSKLKNEQVRVQRRGSKVHWLELAQMYRCYRLVSHSALEQERVTQFHLHLDL